MAAIEVVPGLAVGLTHEEVEVTTLSRRELLRTGSAAALGLGLGLRHPRSSSVRATVNASALDDLRTKLTGHGTLLLPSDGKAFTDASAPNNGRYLSTMPAAVAVCDDETGVATCVKWCVQYGVPPVARGGGHSYGGYSTVDRGLVINIGKMNTVDPDGFGNAVVGGGALNQNVWDATYGGPLFLPVGTCPKVGVGGLVLGGGIGYNTHWAGLTCDHLTASRIVTASGDILDLDESANKDLFWACRGGAGGSFGINTSFTFLLQPSPQKVWYYRYDYRGADKAIKVLAAFHEILNRAPLGFNAVAFARAVTPLVNEKPSDAILVRSRGQFIGLEATIKSLLEPLQKLGPVPGETGEGNTLEEIDFWKAQERFLTPVSDPHSYGDISRYAKEPISDTAIAKMVDLLGKVDPSLRTGKNEAYIISLGWVGKSVDNQIKRDATAYVHRDALTLLRPSCSWANGDAAAGNALMAWTNEVIAAIGPGAYESYQNFPNRAIPNFLDAYYAENLTPLKKFKAKYDVGNLFNNAQSIPTQ